MKSCLRGGSGVLFDILNVGLVKGGVGEGSVSGSARRSERPASPPDMDAGDLAIVFVAMSLFADIFDRESGFDDAFVVVHAGLRFWSELLGNFDNVLNMIPYSTRNIKLKISRLQFPVSGVFNFHPL